MVSATLSQIFKNFRLGLREKRGRRGPSLLHINHYRVGQMCQKFESSLFSVRFPLLDLSCLYKDQNFQNILIFRGGPLDICVLLYAIVLAILVNYMWLKKIHERVGLAP